MIFSIKTLRGKIIITAFAAVLIFGTAAAVAYWRYVYPTGAIMPGLYAIRIHNNNMPMGNFFLLRTGEKYIAIDTGGEIAETADGLRRLVISADDVIAVFITHSHWDHIGGLGLFENAAVYTGNTANSAFPDAPHKIMADKEILKFPGMKIQCLYTPGHTIDHVCYLADGKYLFAGDLFVTLNDSPFEKRYDKDLQLANRKTMLGLDGVKYIFTGHFGLFKNAGFFRRWF